MVAAAIAPRTTDVTTVPLLYVMWSYCGELGQLLVPIHPTAQTHFSGAARLMLFSLVEY